MAVTYFHQPEELAPGLKTPIDDDSANWWAGAQRCFAVVAAAAVLAGSTFAATLDRNLQRQTDDIVPQPVAQAVDEDYWQNSAPPVPASLWQPLPIDFDAGELAPGAVSTAFDDDAFSAQTRVSPTPTEQNRLGQGPRSGPQVLSSQPRAATLQFGDDDPPQVTAASFTPDEDGFALLRPIAAPSLFQCKPAAEDDAPQFTVPTFTPDEDAWRIAARCFAASFVLPPQTDDGAMALPAIVDEEAIFILRRPWLVAPQATIFTAGTFTCDGEFLPLHAGPILARGIITAAPAHALAGSATIAHTAAESSAAAHTCAAATAAAHSLTPRAAPAHTFSLEVVI